MPKVLKAFRCKVTKRVYSAGDEYNGDRAEELQRLGYVAVEEGETNSEKPNRKRKNDR